MNYREINHTLWRAVKEGDEQMSNFAAEITKETTYITSPTQKETLFEISGTMPNRTNPNDHENPITLPTIEVEASEFATMSWVLPAWGVQAIISPGSGVKDDLRTAIQMRSNPTRETIYRHLGWTKIGKQRKYLHASGAIGPAGNDPSIKVQLPLELSRYDLKQTTDAADAIRATIELTKLTKGTTTWPLLAGTFLPLFGWVDFAIHITGRTGTFKSELLSLFQSHYGAEMDARHLPASWSSTPNALQAQAYYACNAPLVVDDFVPAGTASQIRKYQDTADQLIRAQGNCMGRARLTDTSRLMTTLYPRGIILSTGEDTPTGHSIRGRMLIIEMSPGDIKAAELTKAQANRKKYQSTTGALIQTLAANPVDLTEQAEEYRDQLREIGHNRTPAMLGRMIACTNYFLEWSAQLKAISKTEADKLKKVASAAIIAAGQEQSQYLEESDPIDVFTATIRQVLASGGGHMRSMSGGVPLQAQLLGWTEEASLGEMATWKARGPLIGWVNWKDDELYLDAVAGLPVITKHAGKDIPLSRQTLLKRMRDAGIMARNDETRQRNTIRVTADGHMRNVIALKLAQTLDQNEVPDGNE